MPLFAAPSLDNRCSRCGDLGVWMTPAGAAAVCPVIQMGQPHVEPNAAAKLIERATRSLAFRELPILTLPFEVARTLSYSTSSEPCDREYLLNKHFGWQSASRLRKFHYVIEELRSGWLLPIGSRKEEPFGYWIITDEADFKDWFERTRSAPIKQLSTIHKVARANFPIFAEQIELEFWKDMAEGV